MWFRGYCVAIVLLFAVANAVHAQERPYEVEVVRGFESEVSLKEVQRTALEVLSRPLRAEEEPGGRMNVSAVPKIHRIVGCRGSDLPEVDPRISPRPQPFVWVALARGSFTVPHFGELEDVEGFLLVDPRTGVFFGQGVFNIYDQLDGTSTE